MSTSAPKDLDFKKFFRPGSKVIRFGVGALALAACAALLCYPLKPTPKPTYQSLKSPESLFVPLPYDHPSDPNSKPTPSKLQNLALKFPVAVFPDFELPQAYKAYIKSTNVIPLKEGDLTQLNEGGPVFK